MKHNYMKKRCLALGAGMAVMASSLLWSTPLLASSYSVSGESNTILRMRTTIDKKDLLPAYEYLRLSVSDNSSDGSGLSFYLGAWGRADLLDKSSNNRTEGDLQYANLSYRAAKNNAIATAGRQFVSEGVAAERIDGLYARTDIDYGIGAAAFFGNSVVTEPTYNGGTLVYGARVTQSDKKYYTVGLSALKSEQDGSGSYREEEGIDIWVRPMKEVDVTGRSSYNSLTDGWMEHAYALSIMPSSTVRISGDVSNILYKNYFYHMTTSAFMPTTSGFISNDEKMVSYGTAVSYVLNKNVTVAADFKAYSYEIAGRANYFGGKLTYSIPDSYSAGFAVHRMDGKTDRLSYNEYRLFAAKQFGHTHLVIDAVNHSYGTSINGVKNSYVLTGGAGYEFNDRVKVAADVEYSKNPDFDNEVRGFLKVTYAFDTKRGEGRAKSEK